MGQKDPDFEKKKRSGLEGSTFALPKEIDSILNMPQRFANLMYNLFEREELHIVSFSELEVDMLYCVHLEISGQSENQVEVILPADTFMFSCYQSHSASGFQGMYFASMHGEHPGKFGILSPGMHLVLVGQTAWLFNTFKRLNIGKRKKGISALNSLPFRDFQFSNTMLTRQAQLLLKERLSKPGTMDLHGFAVLLLREWEGIQDFLGRIETGRDKWLVSQTKNLMEQHLEGQPLSLETIAQTLAVSVSKLKIAFRSEMGVSVYRHYLNLRLDHARALLNTNRYNVSEVAYRIGYNSVSKFSKMFVERHGILPSICCKSVLQLA